MPDGSERSVGQWAAGDPKDGLAYFRRRYDDLVVEVDLTRRRLKTGHASPDQAQAVIAKINTAVQEPTFVGDIPALNQKVVALADLVAVRRLEISEAKAKAKEEAAARRVAIADGAESLADSDQWKTAGQRFRDLLDEWKGLPRFDKSAEQQQWERFSAARSRFDKARRQHFAELDATRSEAAKVKQELVARAQAMSASTDWGATSRAYRDLMEEWKAAPRAGRDDDNRLWTEFRAAQDAFFTARNEVNAERNVEEVKNLEAKQALLLKAEALVPAADYRAARAELSRLMDEWDRIGFVPRADKPALERRLRAVENTLRDAEKDHWRRSDPAAKARADSTVDSFRTSVTKLEKQLAAAESAGDARKVADLTKSLESSRALLAAAEGAAADFA
jgi:Domain of Unknown Function (DUF349)